MSFTARVLVVILSAGALGSAHAVEPRGADVLPAWSIAAPDFAHDSGIPQDYAGYRLVGTTAVRSADAGVGLKRAPAAGRAAPSRGDRTAEALTPATPESTTNWMLLLSGVVVAGYMARRRTRDVAG
jgi:hypothetical protein